MLNHTVVKQCLFESYRRRAALLNVCSTLQAFYCSQSPCSQSPLLTVTIAHSHHCSQSPCSQSPLLTVTVLTVTVLTVTVLTVSLFHTDSDREALLSSRAARFVPSFAVLQSSRTAWFVLVTLCCSAVLTRSVVCGQAGLLCCCPTHTHTHTTHTHTHAQRVPVKRSFSGARSCCKNYLGALLMPNIAGIACRKP